MNFQPNTKDFQCHCNRCSEDVLTHEKLDFLFFHVQGVLCDMIKYFRTFQTFCNHEAFLMSNLLTFPVLVNR